MPKRRCRGALSLRRIQLKLPTCARTSTRTCVSTTLLISARVNCECNTRARKKNEEKKEDSPFVRRLRCVRIPLISPRSIGINRCILMASVSRNAFNYPSRNNGTFFHSEDRVECSFKTLRLKPQDSYSLEYFISLFSNKH